MILSAQVSAQQEWRKGYLVRLGGDTLKGEILFKDWDVSPSAFDFRGTDLNITHVTSSDVSSFGLLDSEIYFEAKRIVVSYYSSTPTSVGVNPIDRIDSLHVFLEVLLRSPVVTLYELLDSDKKQRFFILKENTLYELRNVFYRNERNGVVYNVEKPIYKDQLKQLLWECPSIETSKLSYNSTSITKLLKEYHSYCKVDFELKFEQKNKGEFVRPGIALGSNSAGNRSHFFVGFTTQVLSRKKFNNYYFMAEVGRINTDATSDFTRNREVKVRHAKPYYGIYGGRYFGLGKVRPHIYFGISSLNGIFDTGVGIAYIQTFSASVNTGLNELKREPRTSFRLAWTPQIGFEKENQR